jgi:acyl carrier protein
MPDSATGLWRPLASLFRTFGVKTATPALLPATEDSVRSWLVDRLAEHLGVAPERIDPREPFAAYGLDSRTALRLSGELERRLGRTLSPTLVWEYPNIDALARYVAAGSEAPPQADLPPAPEELLS